MSVFPLTPQWIQTIAHTGAQSDQDELGPQASQ